MFYHVWCPVESTSAKLLIDEQLKRVARSGLHNHADVFCCVAGDAFQSALDFIARYAWVQVIEASPDNSRFEGKTLQKLHEICVDGSDRVGVGYIHTKGMGALVSPISDARLIAANSWRHFMEWGVIDRWREATAELGRSDVVGVNYRTDPWPHFGGNFWWASPSYVRGLIRPEIGAFPEGNFRFVIQDGPIRQGIIDRLNFERWIGLGEHKAFSFYGFPFKAHGLPLPMHDLSSNDIEPFYRQHAI